MKGIANIYSKNGFESDLFICFGVYLLALINYPLNISIRGYTDTKPTDATKKKKPNTFCSDCGII
jgi:hypothetical protein